MQVAGFGQYPSDYVVTSVFVNPLGGTAGAGYSPNVNYPLSFSGASTQTGSFSFDATGYVTIGANGAVQSVTLTNPGLYTANTLTVSVLNSGYWQQITTLPNKLTVTQLGVGQSYYAIPDSAATAAPAARLIIPNTLSYLSSGTKVSFTTTGTATNPLPTGISANTSYLLKASGAGYALADTSGNAVSISGVGSGQLTMTVSQAFTFAPSTYIISNSCLAETGDALYPRPATGDILPPSLASLPGSAIDPTQGYAPSDGTAVYARRLSKNYLELYSTKSQALNLGSTAGRLSYTSVGSTASSTFLLDTSSYPTLVKTVAHVDKPVSDGYISLYAWDYGRSNDMTLIGQYHPTEVNPRYRRIRIGKPAAWVRILYRVKCPTISSIYDYIPLEQSRAIINATHAIDLENKDFFEQAEKYWAKAYRYLMNQQDVLDGHAMTPIQVAGLTYGDKTDDVMF